MATKEHHQVEAACVQLERAITLFLDEQDYYSATTLAGAAEEIFGAMVERSGQTNAFGNLHQRVCEALTPAEREALRESQPKGRSKDGVKAELNSTRNWLKHSDGAEDVKYMDVEREAFALLDRAVESRLLLLEELTPLIGRFHDYAANRHSGPVFRKLACPSCGLPEGVPLLWGDPDKAAWGASLRGELVLAGCVLDMAERTPLPEYECLECSHRW
jgi:hypothetical protein